MKLFNIHDIQQPVTGNHFLEASAGTGKTYTIEHVIIRLLQETNLSIDQILVVTFTKAATRELRSRIRNQLQKNQQKEALANYDQAAIYTLHGFCLSAIEEFAFEAGLCLETEHWQQYEQIQSLAMFLQKIEISPPQLSHIMRSVRGNTDLLSKKIQRQYRKAAPSFQDNLKNWSQALQNIPYFAVKQEYERVAPQYKGTKNPSFAKQAAIVEQLLQTKIADPMLVEELLKEPEFFLECIADHNRKARSSVQHHPNLDTLRETLVPLFKEATDTSLLLGFLSHEWRHWKTTIQGEKEKLSLDDILTKMQDCLQYDRFTTKLRAKYRAAIIDEFQDTDPIQWNIIKTLFLHSDTTALYLVGDPKQSIYAFRDADVYTYMEAKELLGKEAQAFLGTNYRSKEGLGNYLNRLFCHTPWLDLPRLNTTLQVPKIVYHKTGEGFLTWMVVRSKTSKWSKTLEIDSDIAFFLPYIVHEMNRLSLQTETTAVLVKDRYQAKRTQKFLKQYGIPCSLLRGEALGDSLALQLFQELIDAILYDKEIRAVLAGPLFRWSLADFNEEQLWQAREQFRQWRAILETDGLPLFWDRFLRYQSHGETVLERLVSGDDLSLYEDLLEIIEKASVVKDVYRLTAWSKELKKQETEERIRGENIGIRIMTIHASKGLEFETVFAIGLACRSGHSDESDLKEVDAEKMRQLYVACTRAITRLYLPLILNIDPPEEGKGSPSEIFAKKTELHLAEFPAVFLDGFSFDLKSWPKQTPTLLFLKQEYRAPRAENIISFSSLFHEEQATPIAIADTEIPAGADTGIVVHKIFENYFNSEQPIAKIIDQQTKGTLLDAWQPQLAALIDSTLKLPLGDFTLLDIPKTQVLQEVEFLFPYQDNWMKGFIDLCFVFKGKYYIIDWKTNWLPDYTPANLQTTMQQKHYEKQGAIYQEALHRFIGSRLEFGGIYYIFVRGPAFYFFIGEKI